MSEYDKTNSFKVIAIANQKGGVGKTTTSINLDAALAEAGKKILIVDLDPQGNTSTGLGIQPDQREFTTFELLLEGVNLNDVVMKTEVDNLSIIPANTDLSSADIELFSNENRVFMLRDALRKEKLGRFEFDFILIDCPPSLNLLTVNAMVAADSVLIPLQSEFFALEGLSQLMLTIREVRATANKDLRIEGIVLTMFDRRNNLSLLVEEDARENLEISCTSLLFQEMFASAKRLLIRFLSCHTIQPLKVRKPIEIWLKNFLRIIPQLQRRG